MTRDAKREPVVPFHPNEGVGPERVAELQALKTKGGTSALRAYCDLIRQIEQERSRTPDDDTTTGG